MHFVFSFLWLFSMFFLHYFHFNGSENRQEAKREVSLPPLKITSYNIVI